MGALERLLEKYGKWTPNSRALMDPARRYLPGGDTRTTAHYLPYPVFMTRGQGCQLWDADGHEYVDFMNNFTTLILGHAHPSIVAAVTDQVRRGTVYAAPTGSQVELARLLSARVPSLAQVRFCSSGSEATMMAIRAARAFTGRQKIMKIEGGYNGNHDIAEVSLVPLPGRAGPPEEPVALAPDAGISRGAVGEVVVAPFNDPDVTERLLRKHRDEVAALMVEPMLGALGMIPPEPGYLEALRAMTRDHGVLLVFDEVITLRLASGGMQAICGVSPDLTAMGKIIGGGLPVGAFGGREEIMRLFNPEVPGFMWHASTFSGNPLTMAAGIAALGVLDPRLYERLNAGGDALRDAFNRVFREADVRGQATGFGSLVNLHLTDRPIRNARDSLRALVEAGPIPTHLHLAMLRRGIFPASRQMYCISAPMDEGHVRRAADALADALRELRPAIEETCPGLLA